MGDEQGDRSTPLLVYWIIYKSDQLEEVGVYWKRESKNLRIGREGWWLLVIFLSSKDIGVLIEQRVKQFGIAFAIDLRIPEKRPLLVRTRA